MAGFGHGPAHAAEEEDPLLISRNARYGMWLFVVYLAIYAGFVGLNAFAPQQMQATPLFGVNLAILYGCGLIIAAMVLALVYCWLCRTAGPSSDSPRQPTSGQTGLSPNAVQNLDQFQAGQQRARGRDSRTPNH